MQSNRKAVCIIPLAWLRYSIFRGLQTQLFIIYFSLKTRYSLFIIQLPPPREDKSNIFSENIPTKNREIRWYIR